LLVRVLLPVTTPEGSVTVEQNFSDYRDEGGVLAPHTITQKLPNLDIVVKIENVKRNVDIPADRFNLPAEIKALMTDKKADEKKAEKP